MTPTRTFAAVSLILWCASASASMAQDAPAPSPAPGSPAPAAGAPDAGAEALLQAKDAFKKGSWQDAADAAAKVVALQPANPEALYIAGASERQLNKLADAEGHLRTLVQASPLFQLAHFQLGYVLFLEADGLTRAGQVEPAKAKYIEASAEFGKELEKNPTHAPSLSSRAIALSRGGQIEESVQAHEAWIAAAPQKNDPVVSLAATYAGAGRSSDAMAALDRLPDKSTKSVFDATLAAANVFISRRDWSAAVPFLEKASDTDPTSSHARALLTESCARAGLSNDAARNLQTLLTLDPTADDAEAVGDAIKSSMGDGRSSPSLPGVDPPAILRVPAPRYPTGQDRSTQTEVLVLTLIREDGAVVNTVLVPNRIWKDIRNSGFDVAAFDAVKKGRFAAGAKDGKPAPLWVVVAVKFSRQ